MGGKQRKQARGKLKFPRRKTWCSLREEGCFSRNLPRFQKAPERRQLETPLFKKGTERGQLVTPLCIELPGELPTKTRPGAELRALIEHDLGSETAPLAIFSLDSAFGESCHTQQVWAGHL